MPAPTAAVSCELCRTLLGEGLDLCVRARKLDAFDRREATLSCSHDAKEWIDSGRFEQYVQMHNWDSPDQPISTRSGTIALWVQDQYEKDLADWETRVRRHLTQGCCNEGAGKPE